MKFPGLPHRIYILNTSYYVPLNEAISLVRDKRATECYVDGEFLGIELIHTGPQSTPQNSEPSQSPGIGRIKFMLPESAKQIHRSSLTHSARSFARIS